jgi:hypothetical protein
LRNCQISIKALFRIFFEIMGGAVLLLGLNILSPFGINRQKWRR